MSEQKSGPEPEKRTDVTTHFINRLTGVFKRVPGTDEKQYLRSIKLALGGYSSDLLHEAAQRIMVEATTQTWPLPNICIQACQKIQAEKRAAEHHQTEAAKPDRRKSDYWMPEDVAIEIAIKHDRALIRSASNADWHGYLISYICEHRQMPDARTARGMVDQCRKFEASYGQRILDAEKALREQMGTAAEHLTQLSDSHPVMMAYNSMMSRRDKLKRKILEQLGEMSEAAE